MPIGPDEIKNAFETLKKYKSGKTLIDGRIKATNEWWRLQNWVESSAPKNPEDPTPSSAWLFNMLANKHADAMDNYPQPDVLPRAKDDVEAANNLSKVIPVVLEQCDFEEVYDREWWRKLVNGAAIYGVFWDPEKDDVAVHGIDPLAIFWEPGIGDIQQSRNVFLTQEISNEVLVETYPQLEGKLGSNSFPTENVRESEQIDHTDKTTVIDWYYKRRGTLHFCKFLADHGEEGILFSDENEAAKPASNGPEEKQYDAGLYADGDYPFVFDVCYPLENSPFGFGPVDVAKDPQKYVDKLNSLILKNAMQGSRQRYFVRANSSVNKKQFKDTSNELIEVEGSLGEDAIRPVDIRPLDGVYTSVLQMKIDELKETTGNRDFSQGGTAAGVTSGSAIAALQEAGNKLSRDQNKSAYRAFRRVCYLIIERIRQFYTEPRTFRIVGPDGGVGFVDMDNSGIAAKQITPEFDEEFGERKPIFDIEIKAQKSSPFSREIQNQRAQELFQMGLLNPQNADQAAVVIGMMDFEGKDRVLEQIVKNGRMYQQIQQLMQQNEQLMNALAAITGKTDPGVNEAYISAQDNKRNPGGRTMPAASKSESEAAERLFSGGAIAGANTSAADAMRKHVQNGAAV
ncbi:MAG: hypothetical protein IJV00_10260 [Clostridia bacterium]|nr:hypothetical protein [Clostridia bacterium]